MPVQQKHKRYKYHYNIIHDERDAQFAHNLAEHLAKVKPHWKGFYSDQRLPGKNKLTAAQEEIEKSQVNVCLTKPSLDKIVEHMHKCAVQEAIEHSSFDQLIFVAHGGHMKADVIKRYGVIKTCKVIEFLSPGDLFGREELTQELVSALDRTSEEGGKVEKMPVEETGEPGRYPGAQGQHSTQKPYLDQAQSLVYTQPADDGGTGYGLQKTPDQAFRDMLTEVARQLTQREVECLKFLLAPSRREVASLDNSLQVLDFLERTRALNYSNSQILIDMLEIIDRNDLAGMVKRHSSDPVHGSGICPYRKMLFNITELFTFPEVAQLKTALVIQYSFSPKSVNNCKNGMELCTLLETEDQISESDSQKTAGFLEELAKYLSEETENDILICISEWKKNLTVSVDGSVPEMAENPVGKNVIADIKEKYPDLAKLFESYERCDVAMFKDMDSKEIHSYFDSKESSVLGFGGFGTVYGGLKKYRDEAVAVKVSKDYTQERKRQFNREMSMAFVKHYALLPVLAMCDHSQQAYMIMYPWMEKKDLSKYLTNQLGPDNNLGCNGYIQILLQIADALDFLHTAVPHIRQPIRHGDVKPVNILLDGNYWAKLSDAGLADEMEALRSHMTATRVEGTDVYYDKHTYNEAEVKYEKKTTNDVYAFGLTVVQVLCEMSADRLFHTVHDLIQQAMANRLPMGKLWTKSSDSLRAGEKLGALVRHCINANVRERKTMRDVVQELRRIQNSSSTKPTSSEKCVQCLVNQTATKLPCKCGCTVFCQSCLKRAYANPLRCPRHGPTEPPIGHNKVYAILAAPSSGDDKNTFNNEVGKVYRIFTDPKIMGIRESNIFQLVEKGDKKQKWESSAENLWKVLDKIKSKSDTESTVIFYITCHADKDSFKLSSGELVERKEVAKRLSQIKFATLLLICDCCCAADNMSVLDKMEIKNKNVHQWYSCCSEQESFALGGSVFTSYILEGLAGGIQEKVPIPIAIAWKCNQYVDFGNLQTYVNHRMEEFRSQYGTCQIPRVHSAYTSQLPLAYYNSPDQLPPSIVFQGLEDQKYKVKLERRPSNYPDLETLKKHVWKEIGNGYPMLDASYLQVVVPVHNHGEIMYREYYDASDLKKVHEEKLICQFRQSYVFSGRPLVLPLNPERPAVAWKRSLQLQRLRPFITEKSTSEYHVTLKGEKFVSEVETCLGSEGNSSVERGSLEALKDVLQGTDGGVIKIKLHNNYVTMSI